MSLIYYGVCISGGPLETDPYDKDGREFKSPFCVGCKGDPCFFCIAYCLPCCTAYKLRRKAIGGDMESYSLLQGQSLAFLTKTSRKFPRLCLALESAFPAASLAATRM
eukprot:Rmarinus@m.24558